MLKRIPGLSVIPVRLGEQPPPVEPPAEPIETMGVADLPSRGDVHARLTSVVSEPAERETKVGRPSRGLAANRTEDRGLSADQRSALRELLLALKANPKDEEKILAQLAEATSSEAGLANLEAVAADLGISSDELEFLISKLGANIQEQRQREAQARRQPERAPVPSQAAPQASERQPSYSASTGSNVGGSSGSASAPSSSGGAPPPAAGGKVNVDPRKLTTAAPDANGSASAKLSHALKLAEELGLTVTSTTGGAHAAGSYHYQASAIDVAGEPAAMARFYEELKKTSPTELFYDPLGGIKRGAEIGPIGGHGDHVHVAYEGASGVV